MNARGQVTGFLRRVGAEIPPLTRVSRLQQRILGIPGVTGVRFCASRAEPYEFTPAFGGTPCFYVRTGEGQNWERIRKAVTAIVGKSYDVDSAEHDEAAAEFYATATRGSRVGAHRHGLNSD